MADPLLLDVTAALGSASITSGQIVPEKHRRYMTVLGLQEGRHVTINEGALVVPTLIHELIHYVRPHYTELGVERACQRLLRSLTDDDIEHLFRLYLRAKRRHRQRVLVTA